MDFSSKERALHSLIKRKPPLPSHLTTIANDYSSFTKIEERMNAIDSFLKYNERWESIAVGLFLLQDCLGEGGIYPEGPRVPNVKTEGKQEEHSPEIYLECIRKEVMQAMEFLEHDEPRVRTLVAKIIGSYCRCISTETQNKEENDDITAIYERISNSLYHHLETGRDAEASPKAVDDTTGWRALETSLFALAAFLDGYHHEGCSTEGQLASILLSFLPPSQQEAECTKLLEALEMCCVDHINRHVRAAGLTAMDKLIQSIPSCYLGRDPLFTTLEEILANSLADNWSQVRMASSVLCRTLFTLLSSEEDKAKYFPKLLPRMCLNRFYLAQGVKLYTHDTWKLVFPNTGLFYVNENLRFVVRYYIKMADADNHVVREAACQAIAELASKLALNEEYAPNLEPFLHMLMHALLTCFYDESWPVRDEACLATGLFVKAYPTPSLPFIKELTDLWFLNLMDPIWSVREDAAMALSDALLAYKDDPTVLYNTVIQKLNELLPKAKDQPAMTQQQYEAEQNSLETHTGNQLYSCGSLAPKLKKGSTKKHTGGCSDCIVNRPPALWEMSDGCLYLLRELFTIHILTKEEQIHYLEQALDVCRVHHFPQSDDLRTTLFRTLPSICNAVGKMDTKRVYLHLFLDFVLEYAFHKQYATQLVIHAAQHCLVEISKLIGKSILLGRVEYDDDTMKLRQLLQDDEEHKHQHGVDSFSPFGPPSMLGGAMDHAPMGMGRFP